jgi:hypothetical protein
MEGSIGADAGFRGRLRARLLASRLAAMDYEPALMVECGRVVEEIRGRLDL